MEQAAVPGSSLGERISFKAGLFLERHETPDGLVAPSLSIGKSRNYGYEDSKADCDCRAAVALCVLLNSTSKNDSWKPRHLTSVPSRLEQH